MWTITTICTILKKLSEKDVGSDNPYLTTFLKHENVKSLDRGLLVELIDTIYVHDNNEITIQFNFAENPNLGEIQTFLCKSFIQGIF